MRKSSVNPVSREQEFKIGELFFSTTDQKGVILSGNDIFVRVSGYSQEELVGEPHNIIRHPDMPRAVFKLLWDYLESGKSIAAYVKNMAADGSFYWVVALATPIKGGYLSIRFKPSSPIFDLVKQVYAELRQIEQQYGDRGTGKHDGMIQATKRLLEILQGHGFESYDAFMATVLREELKSREAQMKATGESTVPALPLDVRSLFAGQRHKSSVASFLTIMDCSENIYLPLSRLFAQLDDFVHLKDVLSQKSEFVVRLTRGLRLISINTAVESAKLGQIGGTLGVIADHMSESSRAIETNVDAVISQMLALMDSLKGVMFNLAAARLQIEMIMMFCKGILTTAAAQTTESTQSTAAVKGMILSLQDGFKRVFSDASKSLLTLQQELGSLTLGSDVLTKSMLSLQFTQLSGMVEASRLDQETSFGIIFREVRGQLESATQELGDLRNIIGKLAAQLKEAPRTVKMMGGAIGDNDRQIERLTH